MKVGCFTDLLDGGPPVDIIADVHFLATPEGGKTLPVRAKYRPNHNFGSPENNVFYIGQIEIPLGEEIAPGNSRRVSIRFLSGSGLRELLSIGREWRIQEGSRLVALGRVVEVLNGP